MHHDASVQLHVCVKGKPPLGANSGDYFVNENDLPERIIPVFLFENNRWREVYLCDRAAVIAQMLISCFLAKDTPVTYT